MTLSADRLAALDAFILDLNRASGEVILPLFRADHGLEDKGAGKNLPRDTHAAFDPVTEADRGAEAAIRKRIAELYPEVAPNHVERVRGLAKTGFYDGLSFFRVIADFMAQTGDPKNTGEGGSDLPDLTAEFNFRRGADMPLGAGFKLGSTESGWV
ncbi:MAG: peptidylprolyl isomerase, partial [Allorhizobium sp.]